MMDDTTAESIHQGPLARAHQTQVARGLSKAGSGWMCHHNFEWLTGSLLDNF